MLNEFKKAVWVGALLFTALAAVAPSLGAEDAPARRKLITRIAPIYPPIALAARLSGAVKLLAIVTPEGSVKSIRTIGGNPVFVPTAEQAVKRWKYETAKTDTTELVVVTFSPLE